MLSGGLLNRNSRIIWYDCLETRVTVMNKRDTWIEYVTVFRILLHTPPPKCADRLKSKGLR